MELLKGCLARVEYLKPIIKQDGLIHEHMRDIELYFANLDALHKSAYQAESNLQAAFDTLSRKVSICMDLKTGDRYYQKPASDNIESSKKSPLDDYDNLPTGAKAEHKEDGCIDWDEIG